MSGIKGVDYTVDGRRVITGGKLAAYTNKRKHGSDFYVKTGRLGGLKSRGGGFAVMDKDKHRKASAKGGHNSTRLGIKNGQAGNPISRDSTPGITRGIEAMKRAYGEAVLPTPVKKNHWIRWWSR